MKTTYIYALVDPDTDEVRYIGKTGDPSKRLSQHCATGAKPTDERSRWIASLKAQAKKPKLVVIEECTGNTWTAAERKWIAHYRTLNPSLTNVGNGGEGGDGLYPAILPQTLVTPQMRQEIDRVASELNVSVAEFCRMALTAYFAKRKRHEKTKQKKESNE